jgi:periplasmic protein TonB
MRRDLIVGLILSALVHGGVLFSNKFLNYKHEVKKVVDDTPKIQIMEMPKLEPDEPEKVETTDVETKPLDLAPPMQADVPALVTDTSFVQRIQPPPPEGVKPSAAVMTIPGDRDMSKFRGMEVFDISKLDQQPQPTYQARPQYPFEMRRAGIAGEVLVDFIVDNTGTVQNAYALKSSQREFEAAAVQAVSKWKFKPGRKGGRNVNTHMQVPIVFTLNEDGN